MGLFGDVGDLVAGIQNQGNVDQIGQYANSLIGSANALDPNSLQSAFGGLSTDPSTRQAQMQALSQLSSIATQGGLDPQSKAALFEAQRQGEATEQAQRNAAISSLAARGMGNSGASINALLSAQQGGANREAMAGVQAAADSRTRAMQALGQMGNLAGNVRGQDWSQAAQRAQALDDMSRARYQGQLGKFGAQDKAYGFGKDYQNEAMGQRASIYDSFGKADDDAMKMAASMGMGMGGGMGGGAAGAGGGGMMGGMGGMSSYGNLASMFGSQGDENRNPMTYYGMYGGGGGY